MRLIVLLLTGLRHVAKPRGAVLAAAIGFACCVPELCAQAEFEANFRAEAALVVLQVTVTDHQGKVVRDIPESFFRIYEDGVAQKLGLFRQEDTPVAVGLVVDNSGSMRRKLPEVVAAADAFARSSNPEDQMFVVNFNELVSLALPADEPFVSSPDKLKAAMLRIQAAGQTALYDAIATALEHIRKSDLQKKVLIVLSDGGDNASTRSFPETLAMVQRSDVIVYTVGLFDEYDTDRNPGVLKQLAKASGGEAFFPEEIREATNVLQAVSRDIRNEYTIGYVPANGKRDGTYRKIRVELTGPRANRWVARTRAGYFAAPADSEAGAPEQTKQR